MKIGKKLQSNLEYLIHHKVLPEGTTIGEAVFILTDPMSCADCIAADQCADRYGQDSGKNIEADCLEVVEAFLKQDHKEEKNT